MTDETKTCEARIRDGDVRSAVARLRAKIGDSPVTMVTATDGRCLPTSRPLRAQQLDNDGALWFFVPSDGTLARDVEANPRVCATYSDPAHGMYVAMSGYARLIYDADRLFAAGNEQENRLSNRIYPRPTFAADEKEAAEKQLQDTRTTLATSEDKVRKLSAAGQVLQERSNQLEGSLGEAKNQLPFSRR